MTLAIGQLLQSRYQILRSLGQGGMGAVYLAEDGRLGRRCAIKESVPDPTASPQALAQLRRQFQMEARTLAGLDHPNLTKVYDFFSDAGNEYIVMDYVEGEDLASIQARHSGPLPEKPVLIWADQVLDALEYLHGQRPHPIIHRDIKPANLILTPQGKVKLVDFGLVKLLDPNNPRTATVMKGMGTPEYAPLEQYASGAGHTDARSDVYSLGATLYHLLTGLAPPQAPQRVVGASALVPPRQANPVLSSTTEAVILKAIEIRPDQRYQSAAEMRTALTNRASGGASAIKWLWAVPVVGILLLVLTFAIQTRGFRPRAIATPTLSVAVLATLTPTQTASAEPTRRPSSTPVQTNTTTPTPVNTILPTPEPTQTSTPTSIATLTRTATATRSPTIIPATPTALAMAMKPNCTTPVRGEFASVWERNWQTLGCPVDLGALVSPTCEEALQGGHLYWRADVQQVYIVYDRNKDNGADLLTGDWFVGPIEWAWDGSDPAGIGLKPPPGLQEPIRGFGWLWRRYLGGAEGRLGWALDKEYCFDNLALAQGFERGVVFRASDPKVYVLLSDKRFIASR